VDTETVRTILARLQAAERLDAEHGFRLPGDSALYIELWSLETHVGDIDRSAEVAPS
jgi:hypothetical protein